MIAYGSDYGAFEKVKGYVTSAKASYQEDPTAYQNAASYAAQMVPGVIGRIRSWREARKGTPAEVLPIDQAPMVEQVPPPEAPFGLGTILAVAGAAGLAILLAFGRRAPSVATAAPATQVRKNPGPYGFVIAGLTITAAGIAAAAGTASAVAGAAGAIRRGVVNIRDRRQAKKLAKTGPVASTAMITGNEAAYQTSPYTEGSVPGQYDPAAAQAAQQRTLLWGLGGGLALLTVLFLAFGRSGGQAQAA